MADDLGTVELSARSVGIELTVKVVPGASKTRLVGPWGTALKVAVAAPPEGGKANSAVIKLLAAVFGVKKGHVSLVRGQTTPVKRIAIAGLTVPEARRRLAGA